MLQKKESTYQRKEIACEQVHHKNHPSPLVAMSLHVNLL